MVGGSMERVRLSDIVVEKKEKKQKRKFFSKKKRKRQIFSEKETEKKVLFCIIHLRVLDVCDNDEQNVKINFYT